MSGPCCRVGTEWCIIAHETSGESCRPLDDSLFERPGGLRHIETALLLEVAKRCETDRLALKAQLAEARALVDAAVEFEFGHFRCARNTPLEDWFISDTCEMIGLLKEHSKDLDDELGGDGRPRHTWLVIDAAKRLRDRFATRMKP